MIKFKEYLADVALTERIITAWSSEDVNFETATDALISNVTRFYDAIKNNGLIFRGFWDEITKTGFKIIDSSIGQRTSRDTENLYQLMMADSKKMAGYPDRSNSLICTTSPITAKTFSNSDASTFAMFPFDGTKIAVLNKSDIFDVTMKLRNFYSCLTNETGELTDFFESFGAKRSSSKWIDSGGIRAALKGRSPERLLLHWALLVKDGKNLSFSAPASQQKWETLRPQVQWHPKKLLEKENDQVLTELENEIKRGKFDARGTLVDALNFFRENASDAYGAIANEMADPAVMGITLTEFGDPLPDGVECWFSGKCVAISMPLFNKMLKALMKKGVKVHPAVKRKIARYAGK